MNQYYHRITVLVSIIFFSTFPSAAQNSTHYIQNSLKKYITTGKGKPNMTGSPQTETEKKLSGY
jgi:hypothetical protein